MITVLIFSKDRAAQLDLLLYSIQKNARNIFNEIRVLYTYTNDDFYNGYLKTIEKWKDCVEFHKQEDFNNQTHLLSKTEKQFLCYLTDDDIVYKKISVKLDEIHNLFSEMDIGCLSLRLGRNTVIQNLVTNEQINCPNYSANYDGKFLVWNKYLIQGNNNYNYNLSIDGHIYRSKVINNFIKGITCEHPNDFEGNLQNYSNLLSPVMSSLEQSCVVNAPVNKVNDKIGNTFGNKYPQSQEEINNKYMNGYKIKLESIDFVNILGTHQELELVMVKE